MEETKPRTIRLPETLWRQLEELARQERRSLNAQVVILLERAVKSGTETR